MKLEDIGFYTLSDKRAQTACPDSRLQRAELILTDRCNFKCPYCRGVASPYRGDLLEDTAKRTIDLWLAHGLKNVRFSGGEPTLYSGLPGLVSMCGEAGVENIAVSTNGSMRFGVYQELMDCGVNDFSVSFDACCSTTQGTMSGGVSVWDRLIDNIERIAKQTYITVGIVVTPENIGEAVETIKFADSLGVSDIRVVPSAQWNGRLSLDVPDDILSRHKILSYRVGNFSRGRGVRGITVDDCDRCWLAQDDVISAAGYQFPCIIHFRETGKPIGRMHSAWRKDRVRWMRKHNAMTDPVCSKNCLDVCVDYNNAAQAAWEKCTPQK